MELLKYHPDKRDPGEPPEQKADAQARTRDITTVWFFLSSPAGREAYDQGEGVLTEGESWEEATQMFSTASWHCKELEVTSAASGGGGGSWRDIILPPPALGSTALSLPLFPFSRAETDEAARRRFMYWVDRRLQVALRDSLQSCPGVRSASTISILFLLGCLFACLLCEVVWIVLVSTR